MGYDLIIGPGAPADDGVVYGNGVYCRNYKQLLEDEKQNGVCYRNYNQLLEAEKQQVSKTK